MSDIKFETRYEQYTDYPELKVLNFLVWINSFCLKETLDEDALSELKEKSENHERRKERERTWNRLIMSLMN